MVKANVENKMDWWDEEVLKRVKEERDLWKRIEKRMRKMLGHFVDYYKWRIVRVLNDGNTYGKRRRERPIMARQSEQF